MRRNPLARRRHRAAASLRDAIPDARERGHEVGGGHRRRRQPRGARQAHERLRAAACLREERQAAGPSPAGRPLHAREAVDPAVAVAIDAGGEHGGLRPRQPRKRRETGEPRIGRRAHAAVVDFRAGAAVACRDDHVVDRIGVVAACGDREATGRPRREGPDRIDDARRRRRHIVDPDHRLPAGAARDGEFHLVVGLRCIDEPAVVERAEVAGRHPHAAEVGRAERPEGQGGHG